MKFCKNCLVKSRFNPSNLQHFSKFPFYNFHFFCFRQHEIEAAEPSPAKSWKYFATNLLFLKINFLLLYEKITDTISSLILQFVKSFYIQTGAFLTETPICIWIIFQKRGFALILYIQRRSETFRKKIDLKFASRKNQCWKKKLLKDFC